MNTVVPTPPFNHRSGHRVFSLLLMCFSLFLVAETGQANSRDQAKRIHDRIAGIPADDATLTQMQVELDKVVPDPIAAAFIAMENDSFYNVTLKNMAAPWTNEAQTVFVPLNDYTATFIGMVRDEKDMRGLLSDDILYIGDPSLGLPAYSNTDNNHYEALESSGVSLKSALQERTQSAVTGIPASATAGVMTTRAAAKAFFIDGTNRAMFRFTFLNHMCRDIDHVKDTTRAPDRIRQDVSRSPGGDSRIFLNNCIGCHSGMDPMVQSLAYYEFDHDVDNDPDGDAGSLSYNDTGDIDPTTGTRVKAKYHINAANFPFGYVTPDDHWDNYWRNGPNKLLGWDSALPGSGDGAKSMGTELAHSEAFASCQVEKVFQNVCLRPPADTQDRGQIDAMVTSFKSSNYNLKQVFAESAAYCMGN